MNHIAITDHQTPSQMTRLRKKIVPTVSIGLFALAAILFGQATWIYTKAAVAQVLLERAWQAAKLGATSPRPWPWADTYPIARMTLEGSEPMIILSGANGRTMAFGPGHFDGSALPGMTGNCVISAHRDTHFSALRNARKGQQIRIETGDAVNVYTIREIAIIHETDTRPLAQPLRGSTLTLITCYPFDQIAAGGPLRLVVIAEKIGNRQQATEEADCRRSRRKGSVRPSGLLRREAFHFADAQFSEGSNHLLPFVTR